MSTEPEYTPPRVWQWDSASGGRFANINRPVAGATHDQPLPTGKHALQLYSLATPNGVKVTILLEELLEMGITDAEYDAYLIEISTSPPTRVFESGAILVYLAEKFGAFLPQGPARAECFSWLFWQMGSAPYLGGGFGHFYRYAPEKNEYAINRFTMEVKRQLDVLDRNLADRPYLCGETYNLADIAVYPWYGALVMGELYEAAEFLDVTTYTHVRRWAEVIQRRPAVQRGRRVNRNWGPEEEQLPERHAASDFAS